GAAPALPRSPSGCSMDALAIWAIRFGSIVRARERALLGQPAGPGSGESARLLARRHRPFGKVVHAGLGGARAAPGHSALASSGLLPECDDQARLRPLRTGARHTCHEPG